MTTRETVIILGLRQSDGEVAMAKRLGFDVVLMGTHIALEDALEADLPLELDLNDEAAAIAAATNLAATRTIRGVFTLNEYRVPLASRMSRALGLPFGLAPAAAEICRSKRLTREALARAGVSPVRNVAVNAADQVMAAVEAVGLPCVVKPANDAGSNLVTKCETVEAVAACVAAILAQATNYIGQAAEGCALVEEFLAGPELSVESYTTNGVTTVLGVTEKLVAGTVEAGHITPARIAAATRAEVDALVASALAATGVDNAATHVEVKLTPAGPRIVEINARPGGDRITVLTALVTGVDLREVALRLAVGLPLATPARPHAPAAAIRFLLAERAGTVGLGDIDAARAMAIELSLSVQSGDQVVPTTSNYDRLGHLAATGATADDALASVDAALATLALCIDPS